jgi:hypothetical protein
MPGSALFRELVFLVVVLPALVVSPLVRAVDVPAASLIQPSMTAACSAWREHIGDLIDQHRVAGDVDEKALFEFVLQFIAARDNCTFGKFDAGLRMYEEIPLGRVHGALK